MDRLPATRAEVRRWLVMWCDNDTRLRPILENSALLAEAAPVSADLSSVEATGLEALDFLESGR